MLVRNFRWLWPYDISIANANKQIKENKRIRKKEKNNFSHFSCIVLRTNKFIWMQYNDQVNRNPRAYSLTATTSTVFQYNSGYNSLTQYTENWRYSEGTPPDTHPGEYCSLWSGKSSRGPLPERRVLQNRRSGFRVNLQRRTKEK